MLPEELTRLANLVCDIADRELLLGADGGGSRKSDGSLVTETDLRMQAALVAALQHEWPDYAVLGEEMDEAEQLRALENVDTGMWCIDPLDGTSNFAAGLPYYAVSVGLLRHERLELGVVYDPNRRECFAAARGQGAWLNGRRMALSDIAMSPPLSQSMALIDFKRLPRELAARLVSEPPYASQRSFGAGALDWCWLAAGRCQVYLHGKHKIWDYAAGSLIFAEAGGLAVTLDGDAVFQPRLVARTVVAAQDAQLFHAWLDWLGIVVRDTADG